MQTAKKQNLAHSARCGYATHSVQLFMQLIGGVALLLPPLVHIVITKILTVAIIIFLIAVRDGLVVTLTFLLHGLHGALNFLLTKTDNKSIEHQVSYH